MNTVEAIYTGGVFKPLGQVAVAENQRVRLTIEPAETPGPSSWLDAVRQFHRQIIEAHGVLPDSTPDIAADRRPRPI
jgi:predicted DNA-binding antitoxin AbrB/MazE fold protein